MEPRCLLSSREKKEATDALNPKQAERKGGAVLKKKRRGSTLNLPATEATKGGTYPSPPPGKTELLRVFSNREGKERTENKRVVPQSLASFGRTYFNEVQEREGSAFLSLSRQRKRGGEEVLNIPPESKRSTCVGDLRSSKRGRESFLNNDKREKRERTHCLNHPHSIWLKKGDRRVFWSGSEKKKKKTSLHTFNKKKRGAENSYPDQYQKGERRAIIPSLPKRKEV